MQGKSMESGKGEHTQLKGNILVVDDNPDNLSVLEQILTADGYKVRTASNGEIALKALKARQPDLIFLDIIMPGMDGFEVCRRLKGDPSTTGIPVLFISALSETKDKLMAFESGGVDYVTKPFAEQEVLARVRTHLGLAAPQRELLRANRELNREIKARKAAEDKYRVISDQCVEKKLEEQLLQAQKMESIGLLAGGVAHDFNNILTAISGYGQILRDNIAADNVLLRECIAQLLKASERAAELTRGLLAFSRKQVINPQPVHIDLLIFNTGKLIQRIIGEDIEFCTEFSDKKLFVQADAGQIELVLMNLAANARDAMPRGGRLSISTNQVMIHKGYEVLHGLAAPGEYALITVSDSGSGIDKESMGRLFEPFYTTKEVGKGTGLGLSIVYGIIKQHNGSVMVCSEAGLGTTFNIYLPLIDRYNADVESEKPPTIAGGTETILVADDELIVGEYLRSLLENAGYRVMVAVDGEEALAMFEEHDDISLVLSDLVMPKMNGVELFTAIRKRKPAMKVIFVSGYSADSIKKMGISEDHVDFIAKPFENSLVLLKIREALDYE